VWMCGMGRLPGVSPAHLLTRLEIEDWERPTSLAISVWLILVYAYRATTAWRYRSRARAQRVSAAANCSAASIATSIRTVSASSRAQLQAKSPLSLTHPRETARGTYVPCAGDICPHFNENLAAPSQHPPALSLTPRLPRQPPTPGHTSLPPIQGSRHHPTAPVHFHLPFAGPPCSLYPISTPFDPSTTYRRNAW